MCRIKSLSKINFFKLINFTPDFSTSFEDLYQILNIYSLNYENNFLRE